MGVVVIAVDEGKRDALTESDAATEHVGHRSVAPAREELVGAEAKCVWQPVRTEEPHMLAVNVRRVLTPAGAGHPGCTKRRVRHPLELVLPWIAGDEAMRSGRLIHEVGQEARRAAGETADFKDDAFPRHLRDRAAHESEVAALLH